MNDWQLNALYPTVFPIERNRKLRKWTFSVDFDCWIKNNNPGRSPSEFALGDRLIYWSDGRNTWQCCLCGSTKDHWHGWDFGYDLKAAIEWLKECNESTDIPYFVEKDDKL